jgi:hypothetical protein
VRGICSDLAREALKKQRMSLARKGKLHTPEWRAKIAASLRGRKRPVEIGQKVRAALKGKRRDQEFCNATSEGLKRSYQRRGMARSPNMEKMIYDCRTSLRRCRIYVQKNIFSDRDFGLGYTPVQLKERIESQFKPGMSWNNYGLWVIDHKKSICLFPLGTHVSIPNALVNLQPLWKDENKKKGRRIL